MSAKILINIKDYPVTDEDLRTIKKRLQKRLAPYGIDDEITLRVKNLSTHRQKNLRDAAALYRGFSQFRGSPIFWLNSNPKPYEEVIQEDLDAVGHVVNTPDILILDSLHHEYGHVIAEYIRARNPELWANLMQEFDHDEEKFCEEGVLPYLDNRILTTSHHEAVQKAINWFRKDAFEDDPVLPEPESMLPSNKSNSSKSKKGIGAKKPKSAPSGMGGLR